MNVDPSRVPKSGCPVRKVYTSGIVEWVSLFGGIKFGGRQQAAKHTELGSPWAGSNMMGLANLCLVFTLPVEYDASNRPPFGLV